MMKTTSASNLDATMPPAIGAEIDEGRSQSLLLPPMTTEKGKHAEIGDGSQQSLLPPMTTEKRKHAVTGDGSQQSQLPPTEKRNRGETEEQPLESSPPRGKQGGCKCKGGEHEACECRGEGGGERESKEMSIDELPDYARQYFLRHKAMFGDGVGVGTHCTDDDLIGDYGSLLEDPNLSWGGEDYSDCCSNPFNALDFKKDTKFYSELRLFGENAVAFLNAKYDETACFEDIERVTSCPASCKHHVVTIKAKDTCEQVWEIVLRGKVRGGFHQAKAHEFLMLEYCRA